MKKVSDIKKEWLLNNIDKLLNTGKSKADISRDLGIKPQYLNSLINGPRGITDQFIDKFIEIFKLNQYALSIPGEMGEAYNVIIQTQKETIETQRRFIFRLEDENAFLKKQLEELKPGEDGQKRKAG